MGAIRKILVPVDFSEASRRALEQALQLGKVCGAQVDLLHVWEPPHYLTPDVMLSVPGWSAISLEEFSLREARKAVQLFLEQADHPNLALTTRIESGAPAAAILRIAREGYDLVVMATHGHSRLHQFFLGSVAHRVVTESPVPVLTVRGPETPVEPASVR
ncbi:MAG TPA: universal stress protein [Myxococcales bacterium]|nr:universal stress protein [Myxococcales bacterium]